MQGLLPRIESQFVPDRLGRFLPTAADHPGAAVARHGLDFLQHSHQRRLYRPRRILVDDMRTLAPAAGQQAFAGKIVHRPLGGDPGNLEQTRQHFLGGHAAVERQRTVEYERLQQTVELEVQRGRRRLVEFLEPGLITQGIERIHGKSLLL